MVTSSPTIITSVSAQGIHISRDDEPLLIAWGEIEAITVFMAPDEDERVFAMTIEHAEERVLFTYERQPTWEELIEMLDVSLPAIMPFQFWSAILTQGFGSPLEIYDRGYRGHLN